MSGRLPRLGFLGTGWIGRHRLQAIRDAGLAEIVAIADAAPEALDAAAALVPGARRLPDLDALLGERLDGLVIATPSAQHAAQALQALRQGVAVFCQKPLGRDAAEVAAVLQAARQADRLLAVDLSYRGTAAMRRIRALADSGALGRIHAVDLVFHNAYGPDKPWFYDRAHSGGGCLIDLGVHLLDLAMWVLGFPAVPQAAGLLQAQGRPLPPDAAEVEDYASAQLQTAEGTLLRLACSWRLHAGREAVIGATFHGTEGGAALRNIGGSFYDFEAVQLRGTREEVLLGPPDDWGGRAATDWAASLAQGGRFDPAAAELLEVARLLDRLYGRTPAVALAAVGAG
ncbi:Gfo/Idh/MocA family protein [Roseomonas sp. USHLN139]|uniref:Gfo/Idh/MocA family protein n=1 Tax=Roseomonas sp. USHLN139 TaxID=3081298 RepID=UPI003B015FCF